MASISLVANLRLIPFVDFMIRMTNHHYKCGIVLMKNTYQSLLSKIMPKTIVMQVTLYPLIKAYVCYNVLFIYRLNTGVNVACFWATRSVSLTSTRSSLLVRTQFSSGNVSQRLSNVVMLSLQKTESTCFEYAAIQSKARYII